MDRLDVDDAVARLIPRGRDLRAEAAAACERARQVTISAIELTLVIQDAGYW